MSQKVEREEIVVRESLRNMLFILGEGYSLFVKGQNKLKLSVETIHKSEC